MIININRENEFQTFKGFGASGAWWAQEVGGWDNIDEGSGIAVRDRISQLLYSKDNGIGLRIYRYNIGGGSKESKNDRIIKPLRKTESFEISAGEYDFSRDKNAVYMMKQAVKDGADEVIFFVNSPIPRLTKSKKAHCDRSRLFRDNIAKKNYSAFALYCLDVTEHFLNEGIPIKYISPVNEPLWTWTRGQEGCHYSPKSAGGVLKVFADEMNKRKAFDNVKLSGLENGDIRWFNKSYTRNLLKYENVRKKIDSVDIHSYCLPAPLPCLNNRVAFLKRYRKWMDRHYPNIDIKMSEWTHMKRGRDSSMASALVMANVIYEDISILNVTSWQHWIAVSESNYCDGLIYINLSDKTFAMTKRYYATGNFSKYIPYDAKRVEAYSDDADLKLLAFIKENKTVLIIINDTDNEKSVSLEKEYCDEITLAVTNAKDNLKEYTVKNKADIKISAKSVNTVVFHSY
ncbi:MAG: glycoside hydrolase [Eubacterium sp.]